MWFTPHALRRAVPGRRLTKGVGSGAGDVANSRPAVYGLQRIRCERCAHRRASLVRFSPRFFPLSAAATSPRSRVRAEASGWGLRWRQGREHGPVRGRRQPATRSPRPCPQRRAGPQQKGLPTNVWPSQNTPRRALLARGARSRIIAREQNTAQQCSSGLLSPSPGPKASVGRPSRVGHTCRACVAPRPSAPPRPLRRSTDAGDPFL